MKPIQGWVFGLLIAVALVGLSRPLVVYWDWFATEPCGMESRSTTLRNLGLVVGGVIAIVFGIWRGIVAHIRARAAQAQAESSEHQAETSRLGLLNERYQKAAEMLGNELLFIRLGAIYALQYLAEDKPEQYHVQILRLFCAVVRQQAKDGNSNSTANPSGNKEQQDIKDRVRASMVPEYVQAIMTAIGARSTADIKLEKKEGFVPDLSGAQLRCVHLTDANLSGVDLSDAVFAPPDLEQSLRETLELVMSRLSGAILTGVNLTGANLDGADLSCARGLTQKQLDKARINPALLAKEPNLTSTFDVETHEPLVWRGKKP